MTEVTVNVCVVDETVQSDEDDPNYCWYCKNTKCEAPMSREEYEKTNAPDYCWICGGTCEVDEEDEPEFVEDDYCDTCGGPCGYTL